MLAAYIGLVLRTPATPALAGTGLVATLVPLHRAPLWAATVGAMRRGALMGPQRSG